MRVGAEITLGYTPIKEFKVLRLQMEFLTTEIN
jgi:hypothetical protein